jgi:hypothetical protein
MTQRIWSWLVACINEGKCAHINSVITRLDSKIPVLSATGSESRLHNIPGLLRDPPVSACHAGSTL